MMKTIIHELQAHFNDATMRAFPDLGNVETEITQSTQQKFGDYQCNSAMKFTKDLKQNPRVIAEAIVKNVHSPLVKQLEIAGPGFINITLATEELESRLNTMLVDSHLGVELPQKHHKVIVEFSSPNIAKELHVGHLRSTIIGESIARIFEFLGYDVLRLNHLGDWGTQFGMLIAYIKEVSPQVLTGKAVVDLPQLMQWYKEAKAKFDADEAFKKRSQLEVVALQGGRKESVKAWNTICEISKKAYREIYELLDVTIEDRGESFYNPMLPGIIDDLEKKKLITHSQGAKCLFLDGFTNRDGDPLPLMVQKSDGGYNYDTTDMAALKHRVEEEKAERIIYITDAGQSLHFQMIFQAAIKAGYVDPGVVRLDHVTFGLVLGPDGKKFKTRSGDTEKLIDLLNAAVQKAEAIIEERNPDMEIEEKHQVAKALGIGAVKYADLSSNRNGDYMFSYEKMLRFEGNTAAFLMYAYVRVAGIKRKVNIDTRTLLRHETIQLTHPSERELGLHLAQFGEALEGVTQELLPNRLTDYLYQLAQKFNAFFRDCRVEGSEQQNSRLLLCELTAQVLKQGLYLLGVETVQRM